MTFRDTFWQVFETSGYVTPDQRDLTFSFELTSLQNRVVCVYDEPKLRLLGVRNRVSGLESDPLEFSDCYEVVRHHDVSSLQELLSSFQDLDPVRHEGYVVVDDCFRRVKVKHPGYVALHHLKDGCGRARLLEVVRTGESAELMVYFPDLNERYTEVKRRYDDLAGELEEAYRSIQDVPSQKEFALLAQKTRLPSALFSLRSARSTSVKDHLRSVSVKHLVDLLGLREEEVPEEGP